MANDCLITKLKGTVSNDSLSYLGALVFDVDIKNDAAGDNRYFGKVLGDEALTATIIGDGYFNNSTDTINYGKTVTIPADSRGSYYCSKGKYKIKVESKYKIQELYTTYLDSVYIAPIAGEVAYMLNINKLHSVRGINLSAVKSGKKIKWLENANPNYVGVTGSINDLDMSECEHLVFGADESQYYDSVNSAGGNLINVANKHLNYLYVLQYSNLTLCTIEAFVSKIRSEQTADGDTVSGSINLNTIHDGFAPLTLGGTSISTLGTHAANLNWDATHITITDRNSGNILLEGDY